MLRRSLFLAGAVAATAVPALAQSTSEPFAFRSGGVPGDDVTPFLYAQSSGMFRRNGLDATLDAATSGSTVAAAVVGGSYLFGKSSLVSLITAHARNVPIVLVAPAGVWNTKAPVTGLVVRSDSPIKSAADLNGKTIAASSLNDQYTLCTKAWVDAHGGDSSTLKIIEIPGSALAAAIAQGRADAGTLEAPHLELAIKSGTVRLLGRTFDALGPRWLFSAWFTTQDQLKKYPKVAEAFVRTMHDATVYSNAHHADTVGLIAKAASLDADELSKTTRTTCGETLDAREIQPLIDAAARYKVIAAPFDARDLLAPKTPA